jgi:hypothetical protein
LANYTDALPLYEEATGILGALAEKTPGFAQWAQDKETGESELALCRSRVSAGKQSG